MQHRFPGDYLGQRDRYGNLLPGVVLPETPVETPVEETEPQAFSLGAGIDAL